MIHCIGNSHANMFTNSPPGQKFVTAYTSEFSSTSIGPVIAYNFVENHQNTCIQILSNIKINPDDKVMIVVGEVDCRIHIPKRVHINNESIEQVVNECATRFFKSIINIRDMGYNMITWCGHPSTTQGHNDNPDSPIWGDCLFRNKISLEWKKTIQSLSKSNSIQCISIIDELINENGLTNMEYFIDYCHLDTNKVMPLVYEKLK